MNTENPKIRNYPTHLVDNTALDSPGHRYLLPRMLPRGCLREIRVLRSRGRRSIGRRLSIRIMPFWSRRNIHGRLCYWRMWIGTVIGACRWIWIRHVTRCILWWHGIVPLYRIHGYFFGIIRQVQCCHADAEYTQYKTAYIAIFKSVEQILRNLHDRALGHVHRAAIRIRGHCPNPRGFYLHGERVQGLGLLNADELHT